MNRKQLTLILVIVVLVGGWGLWLRHRNIASFRTTEGRMGQKALGEFDVNSIAQVTVKHGSNQVNLVKQEALWTVRERGGYPANITELSEFLRKIWELKIVQPVVVGPSQYARLELTPPGSGDKAGTMVELRDKGGKVVQSALLGKKHMRQSESPSPMGGDEGWPDGRYILANNQVSLVNETFSNVEPKPEQWLNKDFFKVEKVKAVTLTDPNPTNSWKLARETETGELKLVDAKPEEKLDSGKVSGIPNALAYPSFVDVVAEPKPEQTGLDKPTVAVLETFDNFTYTVKVGGKTNEDNHYLTIAVTADLPKERTPGKDEKPEEKEKLDKEFKEKVQKLADKLKQEKAYERSTYLVSKWTVDSLLKERHALLAEKKEEPAKPAGAEATPTPAPPAPVTPLPPKVELKPPPRPPSSTNALKAPLPPTPPEPKTDKPVKSEGQPAAPKP